MLALGSNLGDRLANLQGGVDCSGADPGLEDVAVSPVYETAPVGGPDQPDYLNAVLVAVTSLPARAVLDRGQAAEAALAPGPRPALGAAHPRRRRHRVRRRDQRRPGAHAAASARARAGVRARSLARRGSRRGDPRAGPGRRPARRACPPTACGGGATPGCGCRHEPRPGRGRCWPWPRSARSGLAGRPGGVRRAADAAVDRGARAAAARRRGGGERPEPAGQDRRAAGAGSRSRR